ncbi:MAG TPA: GtrA family protein [Xanthomonadaceae bacterium]|nr:GtrA family protein [Xanthomonadaceae bacterium]
MSASAPLRRPRPGSALLAFQPLRFVLNGLAATLVHYLVLSFFMHGIGLPSAGLANTLAAGVGIVVSFLGNRHFVFRAAAAPVGDQLIRFWTLYVLLAMLQGLLLFLWTDLGGLDYRIGFLIGVALQAVLSYLGGRHWVFRASN